MFNPELVKLGSTGTSVLLLQEILIARGFKGKNGKSLTLSRKADENTIYALKAYQKSRKGVLEVDGIAGEKTWKDLDCDLKRTPGRYPSAGNIVSSEKCRFLAL